MAGSNRPSVARPGDRRIGEKHPSRKVKRRQCPRSVESRVIPAKAGIHFALAWTPALAGVTTTFPGLGGLKGARPLARTHGRGEATLRQAQGGERSRTAPRPYSRRSRESNVGAVRPSTLLRAVSAGGADIALYVCVPGVAVRPVAAHGLRHRIHRQNGIVLQVVVPPT
jgi:hypothetical protein